MIGVVIVTTPSKYIGRMYHDGMKLKNKKYFHNMKALNRWECPTKVLFLSC